LSRSATSIAGEGSGPPVQPPLADNQACVIDPHSLLEDPAVRLLDVVIEIDHSSVSVPPDGMHDLCARFASGAPAHTQEMLVDLCVPKTRIS
jgi:hypothetical protein